MTIKTFEVRDEATFIAVVAIRMLADNPTQAYYIHAKSGYPKDGTSIMLMRLYDGKATNDPFAWGALTGSTRTLPIAHEWIINNFGSISDGDVIDVQFILGETTMPKVSERLVKYAANP